MPRKVTNAEINETFIIEPQFLTGGSEVVSACTAFFANEIEACSGDTRIAMSTGQIDISHSLVPMGDSTADLGSPFKRFRNVNTLSGSSTHWKSTIISATSVTAEAEVITNYLKSYSGNTSVLMGTNQIELSHTLLPQVDGTVDIGTSVKRFRNLNTLSGSTTYWSAGTILTNTISANTVNLGFDSQNNLRILNADTSILKNDVLDSGTY